MYRPHVEGRSAKDPSDFVADTGEFGIPVPLVDVIMKMYRDIEVSTKSKGSLSISIRSEARG
jgi:hypothetical protein